MMGENQMADRHPRPELVELVHHSPGAGFVEGRLDHDDPLTELDRQRVVSAPGQMLNIGVAGYRGGGNRGLILVTKRQAYSMPPRDIL